MITWITWLRKESTVKTVMITRLQEGTYPKDSDDHMDHMAAGRKLP